MEITTKCQQILEAIIILKKQKTAKRKLNGIQHWDTYTKHLQQQTY